MRKTTNWDLYYAKQIGDPRTRAPVEDELTALRVGAEIARPREKTQLSQTELAARTGMSAPDISRIETSPAQNMKLETPVKIARALGREIEIAFRARRNSDVRRP